MEAVNINFETFVRLFVSVMFIIISIPLRKTKRNNFLGIRLKRALESDIIWNKTNVFTSNAIIICSIVNILIAPFIQTEGDLLYYIWNVMLLLPIILGCIYCYICKE